MKFDNSEKKERDYFLDNGKAVASFLGIFFHVTLVFTDPTWLISVNKENFIPHLNIYTEYINLFRMPLFLFVSGYFTAYALTKSNFIMFAKQRIIRLGLPLISTLLTFNVLQSYFILQYMNKKDISELLKTIYPWSSSFTLSHLWFIYYIIIFSFLVCLIKKVSQSLGIKREIRFNIKFVDAFMIFSSIIFLVVCWTLNKITSFEFPLFSFLTIGTFFPYFFFGILAFNYKIKNAEFFINSSKRRLFLISITLLISLIMREFTDLYFPSASTILTPVIRYSLLIIILNGLYRFLNKSNVVLAYMSKSSYVVYLIHQPIIVIVSYFYIKYFNIYISYSLSGYIVVLVVAIGLIYSIDYMVIQRSSIAKFLFTGKK